MKLHLLMPSVVTSLTVGLGSVLTLPSDRAIAQQPPSIRLNRVSQTATTTATATAPLNTVTDQRLVLINGDGTISRSIGGVVSSQNFNNIGFTGRYEVIFNRDVTQCMYLGNVGTPGTGSPGSGTVSFTTRFGNPNGIFVERRDVAGNFVNEPFFVGVFCPRVTKK
jgi:hypothetical protein